MSTSPAPGWPAFRASIDQCITAAWPEIAGSEHPIFRVTQVERRPWRNLMDQGRMAAPWAVVQVPPTQAEPGWGAANVVYRPRVTVFYIASSSVSEDMGAYVEQKLADLERVLTEQRYTGFQFWPGETAYDASEDNAANRVFIPTNQPLFAGALAFRAVFGTIGGVGVLRPTGA